MKVFCVDKDAWPPNATNYTEGGILEDGKPYEAVDVYMDEGYIWYELSADLGHGYWENCFMRVSEIDETEFDRNCLTEKIQ